MKQKKHGLRQTLSKIFRRIQIYSSHIFFGTATTQKRLLTNQLYVRLTLGRQQVSIHVSHHNMAWLYPDQRWQRDAFQTDYDSAYVTT